MRSPILADSGREAVADEASTIAVYSLFPAEQVLTPTHAATLYNERKKRCLPRETYPVLPWSMGNLVGTVWRNVHCGVLTEVVALQRDRWDNPTLCIQSTYAWGRTLPWSLGFWLNERTRDRYVIEQWVRMDHLSVEDQLPWLRFRLEWVNAHITVDSQRLAECIRSGDTVNRKAREEDLARSRRELAYTARQMHPGNTLLQGLTLNESG